MKIDRNKLKKSTTEVPADCRVLIEKLRNATEDDLYKELQAITTVASWTYGKCELYHWSDILDKFDEIMEKACKKETDKWTLACDLPSNERLKELLLYILDFTSLLIEHSFSRHLYNSMEHLTTLLSSCDMTVVLGVLNLLYVFSKRSNFITRLSNDKKQGLLVRLTHLAESWGGKDNGFGLAECCKDVSISSFPTSATTLHFEFYVENKDEKGSKKNTANTITSIHMENLDKSTKLPSQIMEDLLTNFKIPEEKQMLLYTHIRLAHLFSNYHARVQCVQARLQALAILVYSNAIQENMNSLLYPGLIEELVDIVELKDNTFVEIKAASLRTLTSIIHLERNPKLNNIIDATGASSYHGFLPVLVRSCIQHMTDPHLTPFPQKYATALFSFLYHLASYENGVEALVSCGMMECLLKVINWYGDGQEHITQFVTRAVRVVDLITNLDMAAFQAQGGLSTFINRLEHEVNLCRKEQPFEIKTRRRESVLEESPVSPASDMETESAEASTSRPPAPGDSAQQPSTSTEVTNDKLIPQNPTKTGVQCYPQRAALLKSMLNFLKKAIPDPSFSDSIRHLMDGSLPKSLRHIISNAEYYGPSLFLLATDVVTVYVFQEPSLLSSLQDSGLTDVVLHALLIKDVPATREVLASLPNVFSALCLNARGLQSFVSCKPFDRLFKVLLSPDYLPAMRRRRGSDPFGKNGDTASNLGNAMDELMRHQPSLRSDATKAIIKLLEEVCSMGRDQKYVCVKPTPKTEPPIMSVQSPQPPDNNSSDEEEEEDEIPNTQDIDGNKPENQREATRATVAPSTQEKQQIPLMDYVLNVMKFVEAILTNNSTDDHCREFVTQKGLEPLMSVLGLPNLPIDFPTSPACQTVAIVCKSILNLSREPQVLKVGLTKLDEVLEKLSPLHRPLEAPGGSVLLRELASVASPTDATLSPQATPLLHTLSSCHAYVMMFVHVCRMGQTDLRTISVSHWGSDLGLKVLSGLSKLYTSLVWESTVLLALCSEDILPPGCAFGKADMDKLLPKDFKVEKEDMSPGSTKEMGSNGVSAAMESLSTSENNETPMEVNDGASTSKEDKDGKKSKMSPALQAQVKQLKPLLSVSSRLCRTLAELFSLLVKLCVGSPVRQRRSHQIPLPPTVPSPFAQAVAKSLTKLLANGFQWEPPPCSPVPKLRLTFLVCFVGFMSMMFDEKKQPFHLMLQKFVALGGQDALFKVFEWALTLGKETTKGGQPELSEEIAEFLDSWLMLIERMSNPKTILDTPHVMPTKSSQAGYVPFSSVQYLIKAQKAAFKAVMSLWNKKPLKVYGGRMSESMLAILCNIIKGENVVKERLAKEREEMGDSTNSSAVAGPSTSGGAAAAAAAAASPAVPMSNWASNENDVNEAHLQQLMDMGFTREHCIEALALTPSLEQATEFILSNRSADLEARPTAPPAPQNPLGVVTEMTEEDQMMQAIAMSLGENVVMATEESSAPSTSSTKTAEKNPAKPEAEKVEEYNERQEEEEPLEKSVIDSFTSQVLPGCLTLLDALPETVYRVCDLLIVVTNRNGANWQKMVLSNLVKEIQSIGQKILKTGYNLESLTDSDKENMNSDASEFAARLHLFSLLFEEMMLPCAESVEGVWLTDLLVQVLNSGQEFLTANKDSVTPKWLAPLLLLLDLYEKVSVISKRKAEANKLLRHSHTWKWFDDSSGRWCKYSAVNNKTIDDAYQAGETSIRFQAGRRRYTVNLNSMVQINEETGNRRPIMLAFPSAEEMFENGSKEDPKDPLVLTTPVSKMETESPAKSEERMKESVIVSGMNSDQITQIIRCIVSLMNIPVESECLHAALRLILRLTRNHQNAMLFAELGGPRILLTLTQSSSFPGFISLASLIFRHIIEEPSSLRYCMEKVVKKATSGTGSSIHGVKPGTMGSKEVNYVFRVLAPAACRDPELFCDVIKTTCRFALPPSSSRRDEDARVNGPQILKSVSTAKCVSLTVESPIKEVLHDLLNCLITEYNYQEDGVSGGFEVQPPCTLAEAIASETRPAAIPRQGSSADIVAEEDPAGEPETSKDQPKEKEAGAGSEDQEKKRPLMPKSSVLRLLSEVVKSYSSCTQLITQYTYTAAQTTLVHEECTVLAFVLDHLLPQCQIFGDRDCPALSRVFIASIASCNHSPDAQMALVTEIKGALQRALALPESATKHTRIRSLTNLISIIIDSCPSPGGQVPNQMFKGQQTVMNNIVKSLLKKGLVTDLARLPHSLDLSSPYMANTINSALKPLETLSRSVNQPAQSVVSKVKKSETETSLQQTTESQEDNTTAVPAPTTTPAEPSHVGEITIEDISDHADTSTMEETEPISAVEPENDHRGESELDNVLDVLLNRDGSMNPNNEVLGDIVMDSEDLTLHDSQMVSQEISIDDEDGEEHVHGDDSCIPNEDDSASDVDDEDDDDDDDDDGDDDGDGDDGEDEDDDEDEEDEDDEGSDMEAEDEDDYPDIDPTLNPMSEFDDNIMHMEEIFPTGSGRSQSLLFNDNSGLRNIGFQIPISLHDNDNSNDDSAPAIPPAPINVMSSHPLLVRQPDGHPMGIQRRGRGRREASCRYNPTTQTLHVNLQRQPNPPVILQRLLGPTTAADVLQLTSTLTSVAGPNHGRLMVGNDDLRIISRPDDDLIEEFLHSTIDQDGGPGGSGVLTYIPSTLTRWTEEAKVLDGDSVHDCVTGLKPDLIDYLEKKREEELTERKEKSQKLSEETSKEKSSNTSIGWESPQNMEVTPTPTTTSAANVSTATTSITMTTSDSTVTSSAGRQISASEAAAAAELIATAVVEDILSVPPGQSGPPAARGPPADTFTTPAVTMPTVAPNAPVVEHRPVSSFSGGTPSGPCNLASLLLTEDSSPDSPLSSSSIDNLPLGHGSVPRPTLEGGSITPEEASAISSSDAVTVQSSGSSEELNTGSVDTPASTGSHTTSVLDNIANALTIDTAGIATPPAYHGFSSSLFPENPSGNEPAVNLSALTSSMMGALSASINVPSSILSTGGEAGSSSTVSDEGAPAAATSTSNTQSGSAPTPEGLGEFPDGVDPSFLEALPENIRQEVIAEQMRLQRIRQSAREQAQTAQSTGSLQVNPEFLAALPPNIQEEVLAQQRTEQARMAALQQQQTTPASAEAPVDPVSFLASLPSSLRQQVLADMDDTTVAVLPPDLAAEAQALRRELEERHRRLMQERLFAQAAGAGFGSRLGGGRLAIRALPRSGSQWTWASSRLNGPSSSHNPSAVKLRGRHLLDHEALTCLLVLLFVDEPKLNTTRLHRVLRNLCYHGPTRMWVIRALLSILQKTGDCRLEDEKAAREKGKKKLASESELTVKSDTKSQGSWLSISLEAALGCRANVFQIHKTGKKHLSGSCPGSVTIHDQASPVVCRHVLDTLIALAKIFPSQFLPMSKAKEVEKCNEAGEEGKTESESKLKTSCSSTSTSPKSAKDSATETDFWDLLIKLDSLNTNKKGKSVQKTASNAEGEANFFSYDSSPLGQLMFMLSHPVIRRSQLLTDRLLRLLGLVSLALPDVTRNASTTGTTSTATGVAAAGGLVTTAASGNATSTTTTATTAGATHPTPTVVSRGVSTTKPPVVEERKEEVKVKEKDEGTVVLEDRLQLAVQVLTSKSCSEEGLEDATNLLLQLSWANNATRQAVLKLLLEGARVLGLTVCSHIRSLLEELSEFTNKSKDQEEDKEMETAPSQSSKGYIQDRYNPSASVVVAAPKKIKAGRELQLPSMTLLTSKTSSQQFFLRILKVIIQLRDAAKIQVKRTARRGERDLSSITEAMAALEAEAEAIMDMVGRRSEQQNQARQQQQQQDSSSSSGPAEQASEAAQEGQQGNAPPPVDANPDSPMDVDQPGPSASPPEKSEESAAAPQPSLSDQLGLEELWNTLGDCLTELAKTPDHHAVLILQPAVEAFFIVHAGEKDGKSQDQRSQRREDQLAHLNMDLAPASPAASSSDTPAPVQRDGSITSVSSLTALPPDTQKFLKFAETHRTVLNQILRQSTTPLSDGPFSVLVDHTRILDFDVKRRYFRQELERLDEGMRREDLAVHVRREHVFEDSFRELFRRTADEWKHRFYIVFEGEEGQDAGGLLREWYIIISREIFNPMYALFRTSPGDRVTYTINPSSHCNSNHLSYYKFVGRIIAKAVYDNKLLECYFTRSFYKHIIGHTVKYTDMESEDYSFYQGLVFLIENHVVDLGYDLTFSTEIEEFGVTEVRDLKPNGRNTSVNEDNKKEYVKLVCQMKMTGAIRQQLNAFMEGFYDIIPKRLISIFNEQELELLISGLPTIDIDDLKANTEYHKYQATSLQVQWFWRALRSFDQKDRAQFLQFVTGTSKVPLQGFAFLEGMNGYQKFQIHRDDRSTDRLPVAHTCFNQLDLPAYETYDKLKRMLLLAINECSEGFGLA
ncbi:E3 ubiquitin-protein ligase HUWE1-like isoform X5 [Crassostrea virginica]